jgi:hypothetical protein
VQRLVLPTLCANVLKIHIAALESLFMLFYFVQGVAKKSNGAMEPSSIAGQCKENGGMEQEVYLLVPM